MSSQGEVFSCIDSERQYQVDRWKHSCKAAGIPYTEDDYKSVPEWLQFIHGYYLDAVMACSHEAGSPVMDIFRKLAALCVACMEVHGARGRYSKVLWPGPMARSVVYNLIRSERLYQDSLGSDRTDGGGHAPAGYLVMFHTYLNRAMNGWTETPGCIVALDNIRKLAGIAVHCMEDHGAIPREPFNEAAPLEE